MTLEVVWQILEDGRWESKEALRKASGLDDDTLTTIINFLNRWNFVDVERSPELLVRRKPTSISPIETLELLREITTPSQVQSNNLLAERLACRVCSGRDLSFIGINEVECNQCHEKQWYAMEKVESLDKIDVGTDDRKELGALGRLLVRLGHPQKAFTADIPGETQYFWFRCTKCGRTSTDYAHGHSKYLTCDLCSTRNKFW
jgi:hypothetical protein